MFFLRTNRKKLIITSSIIGVVIAGIVAIIQFQYEWFLALAFAFTFLDTINLLVVYFIIFLAILIATISALTVFEEETIPNKNAYPNEMVNKKYKQEKKNDNQN